MSKDTALAGYVAGLRAAASDGTDADAAAGAWLAYRLTKAFVSVDPAFAAHVLQRAQAEIDAGTAAPAEV